MYNEELKTRFLREQTCALNTEKRFKTVFKILEPYEEAWQADICTRSTEDLQMILDNANCAHELSQYKILYSVKTYVQWCVGNRVPGARDCASAIKSFGVDEIRKRYVSGPSGLQAYLDCVFDPDYTDSVDTIYRCFYWMAFSGIDERDTVRVRNSDVDLLNMRITLDDETYSLYYESIPVFRSAVTQDSFRRFWSHAEVLSDLNGASFKWTKRASNDFVLRGIKGAPSLGNFKSTISRREKMAAENGRTTLQFNYYRAWLSGQFYRVYKAEQAGAEVDFRDIVLKKMKPSPAEERPSGWHRHLKHSANGYASDYRRWKQAFGLNSHL